MSFHSIEFIRSDTPEINKGVFEIKFKGPKVYSNSQKSLFDLFVMFGLLLLLFNWPFEKKTILAILSHKLKFHVFYFSTVERE